MGRKEAKPRIKCGATVVREVVRGCRPRLCCPTRRECVLPCAMFRNLPLPCFPVWASPDRGFAPEWKVTLQAPHWRPSEHAGHPFAAHTKADKKQSQQRLAAQTSKASPRAEGATKPPKVTRFKTPFSVTHSQRLLGCKGGVFEGRICDANASGPLPAGGPFTSCQSHLQPFLILAR